MMGVSDNVLLFRGAYVWIKFRDVASSRGEGYRRPVTDKLSGTIKPSDKIEARYTPPRDSGNHNHIYLGLCATHEEAAIKKKIAAFYYGRHTGRLDFDDDSYFDIPIMPTERQQSLSVAGMRAWVKDKVREGYECIKVSRASGTNTVHLDEQIHAHHHSAEKLRPYLEGPSDVALDLEFQMEENLPLSEDIDPDFRKSMDDFLDCLEAVSDLPDAEPQHQDNRVHDVVTGKTFDNQCHFSSLDTEPLDTSYPASGSALNVAHGSSEVAANPDDMGGMAKGAPHNSQAVSEFPTMSPLATLQQHSDAMPALLDMVPPSAINHCPRNPSSDQLALKVISLLEQQIEKDKRIAELERKVERQQIEKDKRIAALEREIERLRGTSQYLVCSYL